MKYEPSVNHGEEKDGPRDRHEERNEDDIPVPPGEQPPVPIEEPPAPTEKAPIDEGPRGPKMYV